MHPTNRRQLLFGTIAAGLGWAVRLAAPGRAEAANNALFVPAYFDLGAIPAARPATLADVAAAVTSATSSAPGDWGIAIRNLKNGQTYVQRGDDFFPSASTYKVAVMYEVFRQNQVGSLSLDEVLTVEDQDLDEGMEDEAYTSGQQVTVQDALEQMISLSDNGAAHILADRVGWERINVSMANLGLNHTRVPVGAWKAQWPDSDWRSQESCTSPNDLLTFFDRLYHGQLVSPAASQQMIQLLLDDQLNDRIPALLPDGTKVAHKVGNLDGVVNDAGIVYGPPTDFILVFLANNVDSDAATSAEANLALAIYNLYAT